MSSDLHRLRRSCHKLTLEVVLLDILHSILLMLWNQGDVRLSRQSDRRLPESARCTNQDQHAALFQTPGRTTAPLTAGGPSRTKGLRSRFWFPGDMFMKQGQAPERLDSASKPPPCCHIMCTRGGFLKTHMLLRSPNDTRVVCSCTAFSFS